MPFRRLIDALAPPPEVRRELERLLAEGSLHVAALQLVLDALPGLAFVVSGGGVVQFANTRARAELRRARAQVQARLASAIRAGGGDLRAVALDVPGLARHYLVTAVRDPADPDGRLALAAARWRLTARQAEVLAQLARGLPNKEIAAHLGISAGTVELHVSAILQKAGAESRARLVARVWSEPAS